MNTLVTRFCKIIPVVALAGLPLTASAQDKARDVLFTQNDVTVEFLLDGPTGGHGTEAGFASGAIRGTTLTVFHFENGALTNHVGITDVDGDRIIFLKRGTGIPIDCLPSSLPGCVPAPLNDPSATPDQQVFGFGLGAIPLNFTLQGTYTVVAVTGKYAKDYQLGDTFPFKSIATNPNFPPATIPLPPGSKIVPGTEYVEVYRNPRTRQ